MSIPALMRRCSLAVALIPLLSLSVTHAATAPACRVVIKDDIEKDTRWTHLTGSRCDVLISGFVKVTAALSIQPGTVLHFTEDAALVVDTNGSLNAVGTAKAPVIFAGASSGPGFWEGLVFGSRSARNVLQFVQVRDAGSDVNTDAAIQVTVGGQLSLQDSVISGNKGRGLSVDDDGTLGKFARNSFQGNGKAPVSLPAGQVGQLDAASDYRGRTRANGLGLVVVDDGDLKDAATWPGIGYRIDEPLKVEAPLTLQPGARLVFREGGWLNVDDNGSLKAVGTAQAHIRFEGEEAGTPGFWDGLQIGSNHDNVLDYVDVVGGGARSNTGLFGNGIYSQNGRLRMSHSTVSGSENYGIYLSSTAALTMDDTVVLDGNTRGRLYREE